MTIRVFLVEDDPLVPMMLEGYSDVLGHEIVATAATVAETLTLTLVAKRDFDLAILDVHLADGKTSEAVAAALSDAGKACIATSGDATIMRPSLMADQFFANLSGLLSSNGQSPQ